MNAQARHRSIALCVLLTLAGCAVGPDYQRPDLALPKTYLPAAAESAPPSGQAFVAKDVSATWWQAFHSDEINALVAQTLEKNPSMQSARAALRVAQENVAAQRGAYYPSVGASFAPSRQRVATTLTSPVSSNEFVYNLYTAQLSVSYTPDVFGLNRRTVESLEAQTENQRFQLEATYLTLSSNAVNSAITAASLSAQIDATQSIIDAQKKTLEILAREKEIGQVADADVALQETALANAEALLPVLQKQRAQINDALAAMVGAYPSEDRMRSFVLAQIALPDELPTTLPSSLVEHRPDIRAAEEQLHAASAAIGVAEANRLPSILLGVNSWGSASQTLAGLFGSGTGFWTLAANITQPVFDGGTLAHRQTAAEEQYAEAAAQYRATVINAFQNVADALQAISADATALKAAVAAEQAAQRSLHIAQKQLELGDVSPLALLVIEQNEQNAQINVIIAQTNRLQDTVALFQALGGGWWNRAADS